MSRILFFKACNSKIIISLLVLSLCWSCSELGCQAQDDFQDDAGADTSGSDATNDMMDQDPNTINPQKNQNSGFDVPTPISDIPGRSIAQNSRNNAYTFGNRVFSYRIFVLNFFYSSYNQYHLPNWTLT